MRKAVLGAVRFVEELPAGPSALAALFASTVLVRNLLEGSSAGVLFPPQAFLLHFPAAYVLPLLGITAFLHLLSGYPAARLLKIMVFGWTLTLLPPVIDVILGHQAGIGYFPLDRGNALQFMLGFFDPTVSLPGTTPGIRIEAAVGCILAGAFTASVAPRARIVRGIATTALFFPFFLLFFTWPGVLRMLLQHGFPWASDVQEFLQWHISTAPQLTGAVHSSVFIADMWPVSVLALWLLHRISPSSARELAGAAGSGLAGGIAPSVAGTVIAAAAAAASGPVSFADAVSISGALAAALLATLSMGCSGWPSAILAVLSLAEGAATGWPSTALVLLAMALARLPLPRRLGAVLAAPVLLAAAASPVFVPPMSLPALALPAAAAIAAALLARIRRASVPAAVSLAAVAVLLSGSPREPAMRWFYSDITESFARSSRNSHAVISASFLAAAGGPLLPAAEAAQLEGDYARSEWICRIASWMGRESPGFRRVRMNIALERGETDVFLDLLRSSGETGEDLGNAPLALLGQAAMEGDTAMLRIFHRAAGPSPEVLSAYAAASLGMGDTISAVRFSLASASRPDAGPLQLAYAIELAGLARTGSWDSLYETGRGRFGLSPDLVLARLRAPLLAGAAPDRPDLLRAAIAMGRTSPEVLETAASWHLAAGNADSALRYASLSLLAQPEPSQRSFVTAIECARAAGEMEILEASASYAAQRFPGNRFFAGSSEGAGADEVPAP